VPCIDISYLDRFFGKLGCTPHRLCHDVGPTSLASRRLPQLHPLEEILQWHHPPWQQKESYTGRSSERTGKATTGLVHLMGKQGSAIRQVMSFFDLFCGSPNPAEILETIRNQKCLSRKGLIFHDISLYFMKFHLHLHGLGLVCSGSKFGSTEAAGHRKWLVHLFFCKMQPKVR